MDSLRRTAALIAALGLLAACEAEGTGRLAAGGALETDPDAAYVATCDVRDAACATAVFRAVEALYGAWHPAIEAVVTSGVPAVDAPYPDRTWWDRTKLDRFPIVDDPLGEVVDDDPSLGEGPIPEPLGLTRERGDGDVVELVYTFPSDGPAGGDSTELSRRRRLGLIVGTLTSLRRALDPGHPLDWPAYGGDAYLTRDALRVALGHEALLTLEARAASDAGDTTDDGLAAALGALDGVRAHLLDEDFTPGRWPWLDGQRAAALERVASLRAASATGRDIVAALRGPGQDCERQLFRAEAICLRVLSSADYEDEEQGYRVRSIYRFATDELWVDALRPAGHGATEQEAAHDMAVHFGAVWMRRSDGALLREDLFVWESDGQANTLHEAFGRQAGERFGAPARLPDGELSWESDDGWSAVLARGPGSVLLVQGPRDTDLVPFLSHLESLEVVVEAAP